MKIFCLLMRASATSDAHNSSVPRLQTPLHSLFKDAKVELEGAEVTCPRPEGWCMAGPTLHLRFYGPMPRDLFSLQT